MATIQITYPTDNRVGSDHAKNNRRKDKIAKREGTAARVATVFDGMAAIETARAEREREAARMAEFARRTSAIDAKISAPVALQDRNP